MDDSEEAITDRGPKASPAERLTGWLKERWREGGATFERPAWSLLLRQTLVTLALLCLWELARKVPLPVLKWTAIRDFDRPMNAWLIAWDLPERFSLLSLGWSPYLIAHLLVLLAVILLPRLRVMGFRERRDLDSPVRGLTFVVAALSGMGVLLWVRPMISPMGQRVVTPFFWAHPSLFIGAGLCALLAGMAVTLFILALIRRYGLPFPLTCMVLWSAFLPVVRAYATAPAWAWSSQDPRGSYRAALLVGSLLLAVLASALSYWLFTKPGYPNRADSGGSHLTASPVALPMLVFGLVSTGVLMWIWRTAVRALSLLGEAGRNAAEALMLPEYQDWVHRTLVQHAVALCLALVSTLLFHRLIYNPELQTRLLEQVGGDGSALRPAYRRALALWCGFYCLVAAVGAARSAFYPRHVALEPLGIPESWEWVLLAVAVGSFALYARRLRRRLIVPAYSHGFYEPLIAARTLLQSKGIEVAVGGEPFALLHGYIVGPVGRKELLVSEGQARHAREVLQAAGLVGEPRPPKAKITRLDPESGDPPEVSSLKSEG